MIYAPQLTQLEKSLASTQQTAALQQLEVLREGLNAQVRRDIVKHQDDIKASLEDAILSRYLPESVLLRRALARDNQLKEAVYLIHDRNKYESILSGPPDVLTN